MLALIAFVPLIVTIYLMIGRDWGASKALPLAWALTAVVALIFWKMNVIDALAFTLTGFLSALETLIIVFGAILIMNTMSRSGAMSAINGMFMGVTTDARIQAIISSGSSPANQPWLPPSGSCYHLPDLQLHSRYLRRSWHPHQHRFHRC